MSYHSAKIFQNARVKLGVLVSVHFAADFFCCLLPGCLPIILNYFGLPLRVGIFVVTFMGIGSNLFQIPIASLDRNKRSPRLLTAGIILSSMILFIGLLPQNTPVWALAAIMFAIGCGVALVHPHGLRGTQSITAIAPTVTTPVFMTGGFTGAAFAPWVASILVGTYGLKGLLLLTIPTGLLVYGIYRSHIQLAVDRQASVSQKSTSAVQEKDYSPWDFRGLFVIALLMNIATTTFQMLLPTCLHNLDRELSFGGFCLMMFGAGSAAGSMALGILIRKRDPFRFIISGFAAGIPMVILLFCFPKWPGIWLLSLLAGLLVSAEYPLIVALARSVSGSRLNLSARLGWIVGGTWGLACVIFMGIGQLTRWVHISTLMHIVWIFYTAAFAAAVLLRRKKH